MKSTARTPARPLLAHLALAALAALAAFAAPARAQAARRAGVLEVQGAELLPGALQQLDAAVRAAVADAGFEVQPMEVTRQHIEEAMATGLRCGFDDDECPIRVGLVAEVDALITTSVELVDGKMVMRGLFADVSDPKKSRRIAAVVVLDRASVRAFVLRLVTGKGEPTSLPVVLAIEPADAQVYIDGAPVRSGVEWLAPGRHKVRGTAPAHLPYAGEIEVGVDVARAAVAIRLEPEPSHVVAVVGWSVAAGGALLALAGGATAGALELSLQSGRVPFADREGAKGVGVLAVVAGGIGVLVTGAGVGTALLGE